MIFPSDLFEDSSLYLKLHGYKIYQLNLTQYPIEYSRCFSRSQMIVTNYFKKYWKRKIHAVEFSVKWWCKQDSWNCSTCYQETITSDVTCYWLFVYSPPFNVKNPTKFLVVCNLKVGKKENCARITYFKQKWMNRFKPKIEQIILILDIAFAKCQRATIQNKY